jgi:TolB protein
MTHTTRAFGPIAFSFLHPAIALGLLFTCLQPPCAAAEARPGLEALTGRIVFSSDRSGPWRIWTINANGTNLSQLTQGDEEAHDVDPVVSPDGKTILFSSTRGESTGIWTILADTAPVRGDMKRLCNGDQAEWSPDAATLAFRRNERIWIRELASGDEKPITPDGWPHCSGPAWSPNGKTIAFAARWEGGNGIYLVPSTGGEPTKLYDKKGACEPHFSPDGSLIVYETETHVCTIKPTGEKNRMVTYQAGVQRYGRISPDGNHIVYCQGMSERGPWELYIVPVKGGAPAKLTDDGSDMNPDWR